MEPTSTSNNNDNNPSAPSSSSSGGGEGIERGPVEITLASWGDRFLAWLVDFILVSIGLAILFALISIPFWFSYYGTWKEYSEILDLCPTLYQALDS